MSTPVTMGVFLQDRNWMIRRIGSQPEGARAFGTFDVAPDTATALEADSNKRYSALAAFVWVYEGAPASDNPTSNDPTVAAILPDMVRLAKAARGT